MAQTVRALSLPDRGSCRRGRARFVAALEHVQQKWEPVRPDTRQNKDLEQEDDSKKSHLALVMCRAIGGGAAGAPGDTLLDPP